MRSVGNGLRSPSMLIGIAFHIALLSPFIQGTLPHRTIWRLS